MLGNVEAHLSMSLEEIPSPAGQGPVARRTPLGWTAVGPLSEDEKTPAEERTGATFFARNGSPAKELRQVQTSAKELPRTEYYVEERSPAKELRQAQPSAKELQKVNRKARKKKRKARRNKQVAKLDVSPHRGASPRGNNGQAIRSGFRVEDEAVPAEAASRQVRQGLQKPNGWQSSRLQRSSPPKQDQSLGDRVNGKKSHQVHSRAEAGETASLIPGQRSQQKSDRARCPEWQLGECKAQHRGEPNWRARKPKQSRSFRVQEHEPQKGGRMSLESVERSCWECSCTQQKDVSCHGGGQEVPRHSSCWKQRGQWPTSVVWHSAMTGHQEPEQLCWNCTSQYVSEWPESASN